MNELIEQGVSISVPKAHIALMLELLEAGKADQVREMLNNLLKRQAA